MARMSWEHAAEVRQALHAIVTDPDYGPAALSSARTMTNLLNDLLPDAPREKSVLIGAADARVAEILLDRAGHGMDASLAISQAASALAAATVFPREVCEWVATELAIALGMSQVGEVPKPGSGPAPADPQDATKTGPDAQQTKGLGRPDDDLTVLPRTSGGGLSQKWRGLEPRRRTGLLTLLGGLAAVVVVVIVIAAQPSPIPPVHHKKHHHTSPPPSPSPTPVRSLTTIMNPAGAAPVATQCVSGPLQGLNTATLTNRLYCKHTTSSHVVVWAYQFDNSADYQAGVAQLNKTLKFNPASAVKECPPAAGHSEGYVGWHSQPNYPDRPGQDLECYTGGGNPVIVWTMPTQDAVFLAEYKISNAPMSDLIKWWRTTSYG